MSGRNLGTVKADDVEVESGAVLTAVESFLNVGFGEPSANWAKHRGS